MLVWYGAGLGLAWPPAWKLPIANCRLLYLHMLINTMQEAGV